MQKNIEKLPKMPNLEETKKFEKYYSDESFWDKVKNFAKKQGMISM